MVKPDLGAVLAGLLERGAGRVGDRDAGHLVVQELRVARALQREDAEQDRQRDTARTEPPLRLREHRLDLLDAVQRLGHHEVGASGDLALEPVPLGRGVGGGRVEGAGDREAGPLADRGAGRVLAPIEPGEDLDEPDRVDVPDARRPGQVADPRRVPGQGEDVADPEGVRPEQLRLEGHEVPVAGRDVDDALEVQVVLDPERDGQRPHPHAGHRRVADVDGIDAGRLEQARGLDRALDADRARRVDLDRDHEPPLGEGPREAGGRGHVAGRGVAVDPTARCGTAPGAPSVGALTGEPARTSIAARIAAMCSGVVPQQPPTIAAPAASMSSTIAPK